MAGVVSVLLSLLVFLGPTLVVMAVLLGVVRLGLKRRHPGLALTATTGIIVGFIVAAAVMVAVLGSLPAGPALPFSVLYAVAMAPLVPLTPLVGDQIDLVPAVPLVLGLEVACVVVLFAWPVRSILRVHARTRPSDERTKAEGRKR